MSNNLFLKIWKDPVWSKVISVSIIALITLVYNLLASYLNKTDLTTQLIKFWTFKIYLWHVALFLLFVFSTSWTISYFKRKIHFKYEPETLELDRSLFNRIRNEVLPQDTIFEIKQSSFAEYDFSADLLFKVLDILQEEKKSDFHFLNPTLERMKSRLISEVQQFRDITSDYIFGAKGNKMLGIPREWIHDQPERFKEAVRKIYEQEISLITTYDQFIKSGRATLKI